MDDLFIKDKNGIYVRNEKLQQPTGVVIIEIRDAKTGRLKDFQVVKNMFLTRGKESIASALIGNQSKNQGIITYCALGTSAVAPAPGDTGLVTEIARKSVSSRSVAGNVATYETFFTSSEAVGVLREAALFGEDASTIPGSGAIFCRTSINRTKTIADTLTLRWAVTIG